jgi:hypothetical protein
MPGFDGTGPSGMGPGTGRNMGPCGGCHNNGYGRVSVSRFGYFRSPRNQKVALEAEKESLEAELEYIKKEITSLNNKNDK